MPGESFYSILQVDPSADAEVIEAAYRRLARKHHPDLCREPSAAARMRALNEAYATLGNPARRASYDHSLGLVASTRSASGPAGAATRPHPSAAFPTQDVKTREAIEGEAAAAFGQWAATWAEGLEAVLDGDPRGAPRLAAAGRRCVDQLSACLEAWQELRAPARMARLVDLGAASFRLQLALVRGTLAFVEQADYSALEPLAGLAARLAALSRTIAAESVRLDRSGAGAWAGSNAR